MSIADRRMLHHDLARVQHRAGCLASFEAAYTLYWSVQMLNTNVVRQLADESSPDPLFNALHRQARPLGKLGATLSDALMLLGSI